MPAVDPVTGEIVEVLPDRQVMPFAAFLTQQRNGRTAHELAEGLNALVQRVAETQRGGSITLKIDVKVLSKGGLRAMVVTDKVSVKLPENDRGASIFFRTDDNNLVRNDPDQPALPGFIQAVPGQNQEDYQ